MPHALLTFQFWNNCFFAFLGSGLLYMQWGRSKLRAYAFSSFLDTFSMEENTRARLEMIIFVVVGTAIAVALTNPTSASQAFSAGLGWTGLAARPNPEGTKPNRRRST